MAEENDLTKLSNAQAEATSLRRTGLKDIVPTGVTLGRKAMDLAEVDQPQNLTDLVPPLGAEQPSGGTGEPVGENAEPASPGFGDEGSGIATGAATGALAGLVSPVPGGLLAGAVSGAISGSFFGGLTDAISDTASGALAAVVAFGQSLFGITPQAQETPAPTESVVAGFHGEALAEAEPEGAVVGEEAAPGTSNAPADSPGGGK